MSFRISPRRALALAGLAGALLFALPVVPAVACTCAVMPSSALYESADTVFAGVVLGVAGDDGSQRATFEVRSISKGEPRPLVDVRTASTADACGIQFVEDASYLVFAGRAESGLATSLCDGTTDDLTLLDRAGYESRDVSLTEAAGVRRTVGATSGRSLWFAGAAVALALVFGAHARHFARVMR